MGAIEDQIIVTERNGDYRVSLHALSPYPVAQAIQAARIVRLVQDQAVKLDHAQVVERGGHTRKIISPVDLLWRLQVSPAPTPYKVQEHEPSEEEKRDDGHEPDDSEEKIERVQRGLAFP